MEAERPRERECGHGPQTAGSRQKSKTPGRRCAGGDRKPDLQTDMETHAIAAESGEHRERGRHPCTSVKRAPHVEEEVCINRDETQVGGERPRNRSTDMKDETKEG